MEKSLKNPVFDLRFTHAEDILDQIFDLYLNDEERNENEFNLFPNLPMVRERVKPYIYQENHFWIITKGIPNRIYEELLYKRNLVPTASGYSTIETLKDTYYNRKTSYSYL